MSSMNDEQRAHFRSLAKKDKAAAREYWDGIVAAHTKAYYASPEYAAVQAAHLKACIRTESFLAAAKRMSDAQGSNVPDDHYLRNKWWDALIVSSGWCLIPPDEKKIFF